MLCDRFRIYAVGKKLLKAGRSFYVNSRAYVRVGVYVGVRFMVDGGTVYGECGFATCIGDVSYLMCMWMVW